MSNTMAGVPAATVSASLGAEAGTEVGATAGAVVSSFFPHAINMAAVVIVSTPKRAVFLKFMSFLS
jgi:hypothetical protein